MARASLALPLLALSSVALVCAAAAEGCSLEKKLVCGEDGFTYQNACLAQSQGVKVVQEKPCSDRTKSADPANLLATARLDTGGSVPAAILSRFQEEGFNLIGRVKLVDTPLPHPTVAPGSKAPGTGSGPVVATRITPLGYLYIQAVKDKVAPAAGGQAETPPSPPVNNTAPNSRKLLIWGTDDRVQQLDRDYPYSAVGQFVGQDANGGGYSCSGALVGTSTLFTAGHCVYDAVANEFSSSLFFYPGRLSNDDTNGVYPWLWATTYWNNAHGHCNADGTCDLDAFKYDVAVVRTAQPLGNWVGWLGLKWQGARQGYSVTSAGYPGDQDFGTMWKTTGTLDAFSGADSGIDDGTNGVVASDLDIFPGQSGSNVWDSDLYTRALVNAEGGDGRAYHRTMTRSVFNFVVDNSKGLNLFSKKKYVGAGITFIPGKYPNMPAANRDNWASSATITPGCTATLYDKTGYRGKKLVIKANKPSFGKFDNKASSLKLVCN